MDFRIASVSSLRPIKISVFWVKGLKILGLVGTHIFFNYSFSGKSIILCILKGTKMHNIKFSPENLKKILGFTSKFR